MMEPNSDRSGEILEAVKMWRKVESLLGEAAKVLEDAGCVDSYADEVRGLRDEAESYASETWAEYEERQNKLRG